MFFLSPSPPKNNTDNLRKVCTHRNYCPFVRSMSFSPKLARRKFKRNLSTSLCYRVKQESSSLSWRGTLKHSPTLAKIICYKKSGIISRPVGCPVGIEPDTLILSGFPKGHKKRWSLNHLFNLFSLRRQVLPTPQATCFLTCEVMRYALPSFSTRCKSTMSVNC